MADPKVENLSEKERAYLEHLQQAQKLGVSFAQYCRQNTELALRLRVAEEQLRLLREENQRLKGLEQAHEQLKGELAQKSERTVLLEEELRWLKAQYYGRSIQKSDLCESNSDQQMLFNEAEVLAAIEAADQAHAARTSQVEAHERKRAPDSGRKAIPEHFPRIVIEHDLPAEAKLCTNCAVPHPLKRWGKRLASAIASSHRRSA